nr:phage terminase large subunit [uncultured Dysosmobacter sp.]
MERTYSRRDLNRIAQEARRELARRSMAEFTLYTDANYKMNWHHRLICDYLDRWARKEIRRLMIFTAPRHGKSELVSRKLPAYIFGINPETSIIATSYAADLASRMNRDVQRIMDSPRYAELFPGSRLYGKNIRSVANGSYLRNSDIFEIVGHRGSYRSAGVGGGITGMGGEYIIIDDPTKNREEANSGTMRDKLWDWYTSTLYTRLERDGCILVTLTRWHEDDLAGRLLDRMKHGGEQWTIINLPAECEEPVAPYDIRKPGQALWPWKYDEKALADIKATIGTYDWSALYQQRPQPAQGVIFKREWFNEENTYTTPPHMNMIIQSWDLPFVKSEDSAKCACIVMGRAGAKIYILDVFNEKLDFAENVAAFRRISAKHPKARAKVVENKANGPAIVSLLQKEIPGIIPYEPKGGKEERAIAATPYFEAGNVMLPRNAPWVQEFVEQLVGFPSGKFKDMVDATVQGIDYLMEKPTVTGPPRETELTKESYWRR